MFGRIDRRDASMLLAALTAPSLAVGLARFLPTGPASADASTVGVQSEPPTVLPMADIASVVRTDAQQRMIIASRLARESGVNKSPFPATTVIEHNDLKIDPVRVVEAQPTQPGLPNYRLSGIIAGRKTVAIIDGVAYSVGADLGGGWSIASIDADRQTVEIGHKVLGTHTLSLRQP